MKILILVLLLASCSHKIEKKLGDLISKQLHKKIVKKQDVKIKPIKIVVAQLHKLDWNNEKWDAYLYASIDNSKLLDTNIEDLKTFGTKNTKQFWANIFVAMAKYESSYKTSSKYKESFGVWSRGLFQLSKVDGKRYKCGFTTEKSVHDAKMNIECAVKIMGKLVSQNNRIAGKVNGKWKGGARYWSVLRGTRSYTRKAYNYITKANK